ncbi:MAG: hypothetical protein J2P38_08960 [Candidatus Dormibacteraeota bacterium]|nr:hypothetical protein [Candidatus Dormibacteraeota bacterium]
MLAAWAATGVRVTKPARRLQVASRPAGEQTVQLSTTTYRLGGTIVIAAGITGSAGYDSADLAVLCVELLERSGRRPPQPAYPRPTVTSDQQLVDLVAEVAAFLDDLAPAVEAAGAG